MEEFLDSLSGRQAQKVIWVLRLIKELEGLSEDKMTRIRGVVQLTREWSEREEQQGQAGTADEDAESA